MTLETKTLAQTISGTRDSGGTRISSAGNMVGVDFVSSTMTASTGSKTFTVGTDRDWSVGHTVKITPRDNTANISMVGTVTSYSSGILTVLVSSTGTDTTTSKTNWRIGHTGPRIDHSIDHQFATGNPRRGLLVESSSRTNSILNGDAIGSTNGVVGSGGALPTGWSIGLSAGCTFTVIGSGVEKGIPYCDIRISATDPTGTSSPRIALVSTTAVNAAPGDTWVGSLYAKIVGGSLSNITTSSLTVVELSSSGTFLDNSGGAVSFTLPTELTRYQKSKFFVNEGSQRVTLWFSVTPTNFDAPIDVTFRIGAVQLEKARTAERTGTLHSGTSGTAVLDAGASSIDGFYSGLSLLITSGTGVGQRKTISSYVGSTKTATISGSFSPVPDATSTYSVFMNDSLTESSSYIPTREVSETRNPDLFNLAEFSSLFSTSAEATIFMKIITPSGRDTIYRENLYFMSLFQDAQNYVGMGRLPSNLASFLRMRKTDIDQTYTQSTSIPNSTENSICLSYSSSSCDLLVNGTFTSDGTIPDGIPSPSTFRLGRLSDSPLYGGFCGWIKKIRVLKKKLTESEMRDIE